MENLSLIILSVIFIALFFTLLVVAYIDTKLFKKNDNALVKVGLYIIITMVLIASYVIYELIEILTK